MEHINVLSEDQKFFSTKELRERGFSQYKISKMVEEGKLTKLNRSYYENNGYRGEESDFYYATAYAPQGVICLHSAAVYYNLTTYIPDAVDVAIPRKAKISTLPDWPQMNGMIWESARWKKERMDFEFIISKKRLLTLFFIGKRSGLKKQRRFSLRILNKKTEI